MGQRDEGVCVGGEGAGKGMDKVFDMQSWALREQAWPLLQHKVRAEAQIWGPLTENWGALGTQRGRGPQGGVFLPRLEKAQRALDPVPEADS